MAMPGGTGIVGSAKPRKLAAELLPLLKRSDESAATLRMLVDVSPRDFEHMAKRLGPELASRIALERARILAELDRLLAKRNL